MGWLSSGVYTESKAELCRHIHATWDQIQSRAQTIPVALPKSLTLLGSSTKIKLTSEAFPEVLTRVIYMSPDSEAFQPESSRTMCPFASAECSAACLGHNSGLLAMDDQKQARIWKTALYVGARELCSDSSSRHSLAIVRAEDFREPSGSTGALTLARA